MIATTEQIVDVILETLFPPLAYYPKDQQDFGSPSSVRMKVRRIGVDYLNDTTMRCFGVYLGQHGGKFVVGVQDTLSYVVVALEEFSTLGDLKREWELD